MAKTGKPSLIDSKYLISGASSGLGAGMARELVRRGARVGLLARRADRLQDLAEDLGPAAVWERADVTDEPGFHAALDRLADALGGVDGIIANAGFGLPEPPHRHRPGASWPVVDTNYGGMVRMIDWALPRFLEQGSGHVVGIASMASYLGMPASATYSGSKAAMRVHLQGLRVTLANYPIDVTTICPGFVDSELTARYKKPMPFKWSTERGVKAMVDAIEEREAEVAFPWQLVLIIKTLMRLPLPVAEFFLRLAAPKARPLSADPER